MKPNPLPIRPAAALLIGAAAILATPALAQEVPTQATPAPTEQSTPPAPVTSAPEAAAPVDTAPPPVVETTPPSAPVVVAPTPAPQLETPAPVARTATVRSKATTATREVTRRAETTAPAATTPAASTAAPAPAPAALPAPQQTATTPTAPPAASVATTQTTTTSFPLWAWIAGAAVLILAAIGAAIALGRRRSEFVEERREAPVLLVPDESVADVPSEESVEAPIAVVAAVPDVPVETHAPAKIEAEAHDHVSQHESDADELAGITDANAPVAHRPWLEFGVRPIRAGTSHSEAMVELELIVGNSGDTAAEDVRISTFMLPVGAETEMDRLLTHPHRQSVESMTIEPGKGTTVDATLSVPRETLNGDAVFEPVVVAEARYTLPDGSEGCTAAAFRFGLTDENGERFHSIGIERPEIFHNVTAQLHGTPEHV